MDSKKGRIIVCGGAGFIGSFIVDRFVDSGYDVAVFDHFTSGKMKNLEHHNGKKNFEFIVGDASNREYVDRYIKDAYAVVDMIGIGDLGRSVENPLLYHDTNFTTAVNLLTACVKQNIKKFVFASSGSVYASDAKSPFNESSKTLPESPYAANKLASEIYCNTWKQVYGLDSIVLRFFNAYGPRREHSLYGGAVTNFMLNMMHEKEINVFGDGNDVRDYVYVKDIAKSVQMMVESKLSGTYNVGTGVGTSTNDVIKEISKVTGKKAKIVTKPKRQGDQPSRVADITKITKELGFKPDYTMDKGVKELYDYMKKQKL